MYTIINYIVVLAILKTILIIIVSYFMDEIYFINFKQINLYCFHRVLSVNDQLVPGTDDDTNYVIYIFFFFYKMHKHSESLKILFI